MERAEIAVIGLACRFPSADGPGEFWQLLRDGRQAKGTAIDEFADFDADFFNISPREAAAMDPRQRLALELTWELFEDAFIEPTAVIGEQVAVYLGAMNDDYAFLTLRGAAANVDHHSFAGASRAMIANRVSYVFGLRGPSMTVDSGQSSSLATVHLACESLRAGTASVAVAGGIHLNLADETAMLEKEFGALSTSGRTYAFDARADGYVRGEGGALVLLKPLQAALHDGNRIRAVILGSAVGNSGLSGAGLTAPSASGEADVIRTALTTAGLDCHQIDYVEAHGTGTQVGDPIEARALGAIFGERRQDPVRMGSVKTNIGHTGGAAGIAGLIKTVLAVENGLIPASLNYSTPPAGTDLASLGLRVNTVLTPWPAGASRRAGVSSFGMGGTNAHVIIEQAPTVDISVSVVAQQDNSAATAWVLSARSNAALENQARRLSAWVDAHRGSTLADVGWSLVTTRSTFAHRAVVVGEDRVELIDALRHLPTAAATPGSGRSVFVFPGQGSQYLGMGQRLHERFPLFARAFDDVTAELDQHLRLPLRQVMWGGDAGLLESTEFAQPALFAVEVALATLLGSWGVIPDVVLGHSVGEIAAAHVAGVLSLRDAARVVAARGALMGMLPAGGAMMAVTASADEVAPLLVDGVDIAALNAADAVVISGDSAAVGVVVDRLLARGRRVRRLAVSHAFHSALMEPMLPEFTRRLGDLTANRPRIALVSNVTGQLADAGYGSAPYWVEHVREPVRFADSVRTAESLGADMFLEVGPATGLAASVASLTKGTPEERSLLIAVGQLFTAGVAVDWRGAFAGMDVQRVDLPTYGFARRRYWLTSGQALTESLVEAPPETYARRLQALDSREQHRELLDLVRMHAAIVLGHSSGRDIDAERAFQDLGFESMAGVELRNRLIAATGWSLPRTLIFDHPTPELLARHLGRQLSDDKSDESDDEQFWERLKNIPMHELRRTGLLERLLLLAGESEIRSESTASGAAISDDVIDGLSADALIALALNTEDDND